jgi:acyl-CoA thioester hydrolase
MQRSCIAQAPALSSSCARMPSTPHPNPLPDSGARELGRIVQKETDPRGKLAYATRLDVRWGDMDAFGHVNNAVYFRYMEQGRIEFFAQQGYPVDPKGLGFLLVHAQCNFRRAIVYPARLEIRVYVGEAKRSSLPLFIEIADANDRTVVYADGKSVVAWVDFALNQSQPMPEAVRARMSAASVQ